MPLTHHPVRLFRLSCGCLRAYPMMPASVQHVVLCVRCQAEAMTVFAYPERCCGARGSYSGFALSCTLGTGECNGTDHYDACADARFTVVTAGLGRSREGKTGRA